MWFIRSRFKTVREFYKALDDLISMLEKEGKTVEAKRLHQLMHEMAWTTSSELLLELSLAFKSMKGKYSPELSREIKACRNFADNHRWILGLQ